jgi:branched-chain amino acid transport system ATP-binding protein
VPTPSEPASLLGTEIRKHFGGLVVLDGVTITVRRGEIVGVAGPNGAGKTTLFDVLAGRLRQDHGRITLEGRDVSRLSAFRRARLGLARTFQSAIVPETLTIGEALEAARSAWRPRSARGDIDMARSVVGFDDDESVPVASLDVLKRRKLLLTCLLMRRPHVLLLDEPASGLLQEEIVELDGIIRNARTELGLAVVVVEHRLELLSSLADRVLVLDYGKQIALGPPDEVFNDPAVRAAYFDEARVA